MSNTGQDVQAVYNQYQATVRQLQLHEQQEVMLSNQLSQYKSNLETLDGLQHQSISDDFIFPLSDILLLRGKFTDVKEVLVDIGSDYYLPSNFIKAKEVITIRVNQIEELLNKITEEKSQLQAIASQLQSHINKLSQM